MKRILQAITFSVALTASVEAAEWFVWNDTPVASGNFYSVTDTAMTWFDAQAAATTAGGYLTSIGSIEELNFIRTTFGRGELFWTGLSTVQGNGSFQWDNGEPLAFTYFGGHQPDASQTSAVIINQSNSRGFTRGFFYDISPTSLYRAIIESNTDPNAQIPDETPDDRGNPVPEGGATALLLALGLAAVRMVRRDRP